MTRRLARTEKGHGEIVEGRRNLRGKVRTLLFLIDPAKSAEQIEQQASQIGATYEQLAQLIADGYVVELGTETAIAANDEKAGVVGAIDEVVRFRIAKAFMNDTIVDALGIRAFLFTLRLERCATRADLKTLLPDYAQLLMKKLPVPDAGVLIERTGELLEIA
jgi:hypothetical protein